MFGAKYRDGEAGDCGRTNSWRSMKKKQPHQLTVSKPWFQEVKESESVTVWTSVVGLCIGLVAGGLVWRYRSATFGIAIIAIALTIAGLGIASASNRAWLATWLGRLGNGVGMVVAFAVLTPLFFIGFTLARVLGWIAGQDPLQLRNSNPRTYWLPTDATRRKTRHIGAMFVTEPRLSHRRWSGLTLLVLGAVGLAGGELLLRGYGFGNAVLYQPSELAGFYPAPHQDVTRLGGRVATNQFGMRGPDFDLQKPPDVFRILMIGDSTLYGGQYIDQSELYPRLLQQHLADRADGQRVEVLNIGVNGWGPFNKIGYIRQFGTFDADIAVVCLPTDDFRRPKVHIWDTPYFRPDAPPRCAYEEVLYHLNWRYRSRQLRPTDAEREQQINLGIAAYIDLALLLRQHGCEVLLEILPSRSAGTTSTVPEKELRLVHRFARSVADADLAAPHYPAGFLKNHPQVDLVYHDNIHLDVAGHDAYADYLLPPIVATKAWQQWRKSAGVGP